MPAFVWRGFREVWAACCCDTSIRLIPGRSWSRPTPAVVRAGLAPDNAKEEEEEEGEEEARDYLL